MAKMFTVISRLATVFLTVTTGVLAAASSDNCRCVPGDSCWPSAAEWQQLNASIHGQLIASQPIARSCYPGPAADAAQCSAVSSQWRNVSFQIDSPIGYPQPFDLPCPPVNASAGEVPAGTCTLGNAPVFTVNATHADHVAAGVVFARRHNIRLVVRDTGHDFLGRSAGSGSLQVWIRHLRTGIVFHDRLARPGSSWNGSAVTIGGGYEWADVYGGAAARNLVVVGGVSPTVGCIGGWMQGGGHGPASHKYGLGSDQVLEAKVVLANGSLATTSPAQSPDLFFAVRGGGPSSYGVVVEVTVKAWPTTPVVAQTLLMVAQAPGARPGFLAALRDIYAGVPHVARRHWGGYGDWMAGGAVAFYSHTWTNFDLGLRDAQAAFAPVADRLAARNGSSLLITVNYTQHATYADFYNTYHTAVGTTGDLVQVASRFLDVAALGRGAALARMLDATAGPPAQAALNTLEVHGAPFGAIGRDGSAANPAWRRAVANQNTYLSYNASTPPGEVRALIADITDVKEASLKALAPDTGSYGNVANVHNSDWKRDFFGHVYGRLAQIKARYDPEHVFYCQTCVGSDGWREEEGGRLCRVPSTPS